MLFLFMKVCTNEPSTPPENTLFIILHSLSIFLQFMKLFSLSSPVKGTDHSDFRALQKYSLILEFSSNRYFEALLSVPNSCFYWRGAFNDQKNDVPEWTQNRLGVDRCQIYLEYFPLFHSDFQNFSSVIFLCWCTFFLCIDFLSSLTKWIPILMSAYFIVYLTLINCATPLT